MYDLLDKLKLERDFSRYNYLSLDSAVVNGVDDAANFRTVRVRWSAFSGFSAGNTMWLNWNW